MRGARLEGHHPALASRHHDSVGKLEALTIQPLEDLDTDACAAFAAQCLPSCHGLLAGINERGNLAHGVLDIERHAIGGSLAAQPAGLTGLFEAELLAKVGFEGALAVLRGRFAVDLRAGHFVVGRPIAARADCLKRRLQLGAVLLK